MRRDRAARRGLCSPDGNVAARCNAAPASYSGVLWRLSCRFLIVMLRSSSGVRRPTWRGSVFMRRALLASVGRHRALRRCSAFARCRVFGRRGVSGRHSVLGRCEASALLASRLRRLCNRAPLIPHGSWPCMRHWRWTSSRRTLGPRVLRHPAMLPRVALRVPRPAAVVMAPVRPERESDDRQTEPRPVGVERYSVALIDKRDATRVYPAATVVERHVAPAPILQATVHVKWCARVELCNQRVVSIGSRVDVHGARGICVLCAGNSECRKQQRTEQRDMRASVHGQASGWCRSRQRDRGAKI